MTTYRNEALTNGDTTRWLYDEPSGCMTNKLYADGKGPRYDYTPDGKLARRTWARGIATDYSYDNAGQLVSTTYSDATPTITMSYDRVGNLINATTAGVVTNLYAYDIVGHCTNEWQNDFNLTRYYDALGRSSSYAINGERQTTITYDTFGRLASMRTAERRNGKGGSPGGSCNSEGWVASLPLRLPSGEPTAFRGFDFLANGSRLGSAQRRSGNESPNQSEFQNSNFPLYRFGRCRGQTSNWKFQMKFPVADPPTP